MSTVSDQELLALAAGHENAGRLADAELFYRQLLERHPGNSDLQNALGVLALHSGRPEEARSWLELAVGSQPAKIAYLNNLGAALSALGDSERAIKCFERVAQMDPTQAIVLYNLGSAKLALGRWDEAASDFRNALTRMPDHEDSFLNLGLALLRKGEVEEAIAVYRRALDRFPNSARLWTNLGDALKAAARWEEVEVACTQALRCHPVEPFAANNLGVALNELGRPEEAFTWLRRSLKWNPSLSEAHSNLIFVMQFHPDIGAPEIAAECGRWWERHGLGLVRLANGFTGAPDPARRLRVGYVSPDFCEHPLIRHVLPVIEAHDRGAVEVAIYSGSFRSDAFTARLQKSADLWRDTARWTDDRLAQQIALDRVDILVDLSLHSGGNRLRVFARQSAPVQVSFAGYPGTTGLETIRYRLTDRHLEPVGVAAIPPGEPVRLPDSFWCFDPLGETPEVSELPASRNGSVTFGCLSKFAKVNESVIDCWSRILREVPNAQLLMLCPRGQARIRIGALFAERGVSKERVVFTERVARPDYLRLHQQVDVMLDPFPYNGHMTTCDALWMGVPVVTLAGKTAVARGGLSLLSTAGLPELVASSAGEYVRIAVALANDLPRLAALRAGLRARMKTSPLMDVARYTRGLEDAYRTMWRRWCDEQVGAKNA